MDHHNGLDSFVRAALQTEHLGQLPLGFGDSVIRRARAPERPPLPAAALALITAGFFVACCAAFAAAPETLAELWRGLLSWRSVP